MSSEGTPTSYPLGPALDFIRQISALNHAIEQTSSRMERSLGITAQQRLFLRCIGKYPGITSGQLAALLHLDPGTVSTSLRRLEERKLVDRRSDPRDRRRVVLGLTAEGRALDRPTKGTVEHAVERLLESSAPAEIDAAKTVLAELARLLRDGADREG